LPSKLNGVDRITYLSERRQKPKKHTEEGNRTQYKLNHRIPYNHQPATIVDVQIIGTHCMLEPMNPPLSTFPASQQAFAQQAIFSQAMV